MVDLFDCSRVLCYNFDLLAVSIHVIRHIWVPLFLYEDASNVFDCFPS